MSSSKLVDCSTTTIASASRAPWLTGSPLVAHVRAVNKGRVPIAFRCEASNGPTTGSRNAPRKPSPPSASTSDALTVTGNLDDKDVQKATGSNGSAVKRISYDYGFQASFLRSGPTVPSNVLKLAFANFGREYAALRRNLLFEDIKDSPDQTFKQTLLKVSVGVFRTFDRILTLYDGLPEIKPDPQMPEESEELRKKLAQLTLSNEGVTEREKLRPQVQAPWWILLPYQILCVMLDVIFENRPIQRFWFLETVARMPYFSYISMLHLYETLGWWRIGAEVRKVHFAEEWNEMNHLKIMESLGGDRLWIDRFFAQHAAFIYYWVLNVMFLISPRTAYNFSELIEMHAVDTYGEFADENKELLLSLPPSPAAVQYYENDDLYMFDEFQTSHPPEFRRPKIENLYDVFCAIRDDEMEHVKTMSACQQLDQVVMSPNRTGFVPAKSPADKLYLK